jgi:hypothetical protein
MKQNESYILHMGYQKEVAPYLAAADLVLLQVIQGVCQVWF